MKDIPMVLNGFRVFLAYPVRVRDKPSIRVSKHRGSRKARRQRIAQSHWEPSPAVGPNEALVDEKNRTMLVRPEFWDWIRNDLDASGRK